MNPVIKTDGLTKHFGKLKAVENLNLRVPEGSIFAFLGPNGSGKTTTIKMIMNMIQPTKGSSLVCGVDSRRLGPRQLQRIGYVSENQLLPEWMTVRQLLGYCHPLYPEWDAEFCSGLLRKFTLPLERKIKHLSRGEKVKLALTATLSYRPSLLVLDEPFSGLDPVVRDDLISGILDLTERDGWTIFISSHDIHEVERLADWVGIIKFGTFLFSEPVADLQGRFRQVHLVLDQVPASLPSLPPNWLHFRKNDRAVSFVESRFDVRETEGRVRSLFQNMSQYEAVPMSLRDIFVSVIRSGTTTQEALP